MCEFLQSLILLATFANYRLDDEDDEEWQFKQQRLDMNMTEKLGDGTTLTVSDVLLNSLCE